MGKKSNKGGAFERMICKELSIWYSSGRRDDIFWRTAGSGARATVRGKVGLKTADSYGDVMATHESGKPLTGNYVISLKRGYTGKKGRKSFSYIDILDLIDTPAGMKGKPALATWWDELMRDVKNGSRKDGFIIFRRDRKMSSIVMSNKTFKELHKMKPCIFPLYHSGCGLAADSLHLQIMKLQDFFYWCEPQMLGAKRQLKRKNFQPLKGWIEPGPHFENREEYHQALKSQVKENGNKRTLRRRRIKKE